MATITPVPGNKKVSTVSWVDEKGKQRRKRFPQKVAEELYKKLIAQEVFDNSGIDENQNIKTINFRKLKFSDLARRYLDEHLLVHTRAESNKYYVDILIDKWGENFLHHLSRSAFRKWIWFALDNPIRTPKNGEFILQKLSVSSVEKLIRYAAAIFYWAIEEEILDRNPFAKMKDRSLKKEFRRRKNKKEKPVYLVSDEFMDMINTFPSYVRDPAMCCFFSGIRRSEVCSLTWSMIERKKHRFKYEADEVKETYEKYVYYDPEFELVLERLEIEKLTNGFTDDFVFRNAKGTPLTNDSFNHSIRHYCDKYAKAVNDIRFEKVSPHTFRRSYRTRKDMEGADRKAVAANMGHHSDQMSEHYNIVDQDRQALVAGFGPDTPPEMKEELEKIIEQAQKSGVDLTTLQTHLRVVWRSKGSLKP